MQIFPVLFTNLPDFNGIPLANKSSFMHEKQLHPKYLFKLSYHYQDHNHNKNYKFLQTFFHSNISQYFLILQHHFLHLFLELLDHKILINLFILEFNLIQIDNYQLILNDFIVSVQRITCSFLKINSF